MHHRFYVNLSWKCYVGLHQRDFNCNTNSTNFNHPYYNTYQRNIIWRQLQFQNRSQIKLWCVWHSKKVLWSTWKIVLAVQIISQTSFHVLDCIVYILIRTQIPIPNSMVQYNIFHIDHKIELCVYDLTWIQFEVLVQTCQYSRFIMWYY